MKFKSLLLSFAFIVIGGLTLTSNAFAATTATLVDYQGTQDALTITSDTGKSYAMYPIDNLASPQTSKSSGSEIHYGGVGGFWTNQSSVWLIETPSSCSGLTKDQCLETCISYVTVTTGSGSGQTLTNLVVNNDPHAVIPPEGGGSGTLDETVQSVATDMIGVVHDNIVEAILSNIQIIIVGMLVFLLPLVLWSWFNKKNGLWW